MISSVCHSVGAIFVVHDLSREIDLFELYLDRLFFRRCSFRRRDRISILVDRCGLFNLDLYLAVGSDSEGVATRSAVLVLLVTGLNEELDLFASKGAVKDAGAITERVLGASVQEV